MTDDQHDRDVTAHSPRSGDRLTWHLATCHDCGRTAAEPYCALGQILEIEADLVVAAVQAFKALPLEQKPLVLKTMNELLAAEVLL